MLRAKNSFENSIYLSQKNSELFEGSEEESEHYDEVLNIQVKNKLAIIK